MRFPIGSVNGHVRAAGWGAVLAGVLVLGAPPVARAQSSGLPELEIVTAESQDTGQSAESWASSGFVSAACPAGKTPIGGGAQVLGNLGHVFLLRDATAPEKPDTTWGSWGQSLDRTDPWRVQARAMCVPVGLASDSGLEIVVAESADDTVGRKFAEAVCPSGKTVIGGGAQVLGNVEKVFLEGNYRGDAPGAESNTTWVGFAEAVDQPNPWRVQTRAVCVSDRFAADRSLEVVTAESAQDAAADKVAAAKCPAGKTAVGGGALFLGNNSQVFLQKSQPEDDTTWGILAESLKTEPWGIRAQVICVGAAAAPTNTSTTLPSVEPRGDEQTTQAQAQDISTTPIGGVRAGAGGTARDGSPVLPVATGALGAVLVGGGLSARRRTRVQRRR